MFLPLRFTRFTAPRQRVISLDARNPLEAALSKRSASAGDDISEGSEEGKSMNMQEIFSETIEILLQMLYNITA